MANAPGARKGGAETAAWKLGQAVLLQARWAPRVLPRARGTPRSRRARCGPRRRDRCSSTGELGGVAAAKTRAIAAKNSSPTSLTTQGKPARSASVRPTNTVFR
ncbi:hypothetical protein G6F59_017592 [Rhizopus arrhizus]|nr:hypothetical protein G6F59_017592 [Rhizopus arrhizus]